MKTFALLLTVTACFAQQPRAFDVASVKLNTTGSGGINMRTQHGHLTVENAPLFQIIQQAFRVKEFQLSGGRGWIMTERYNIDARMEKDDVSDNDLWFSLQPLLASRFHLKFHRETKTMPVFSLVVTKPGPKFQAHKEGAEGKDQPRLGVSIGSGKGKLTATKTTMASFADSLGHQVDRIVVDNTGLKGEYDFILEWSPENHEGSIVSAVEEKIGLTGLSIFDALPQQLGLKLESAKGPVQVIVIDSVDRPSSN
ncbi:MAG TPA: TIGR03435 family protein [Bryobacteraceae bacterium]|nr:TIGR03435 family protein [Bryobacteraceae bacterium]